MNLNNALLSLRGEKPAITHESLFSYRLNEGQEETMEETEFPPIPHVTIPPQHDKYHITSEEANGLYDCATPQKFLLLVDMMKAKRLGSWPPPGFHACFHTTGVLHTKNIQYKGQPYYQEWVDEVYTPRPGVCFYKHQIVPNEKKALRDCPHCPGIPCHCDVRETPIKKKTRKELRREADLQAFEGFEQRVRDLQCVATEEYLSTEASIVNTRGRSLAPRGERPMNSSEGMEEESESPDEETGCVQDDYEITPWQEMEE